MGVRYEDVDVVLGDAGGLDRFSHSAPEIAARGSCFVDLFIFDKKMRLEFISSSPRDDIPNRR